MAQQSGLSARWRALAVALSLAWLGSVIIFGILTLSGSGNRLSGIAGILVMLSSLVVLTLLKNLSKVASEEIPAPGDWETKLATVAVLMLAAAWVLHFAA